MELSENLSESHYISFKGPGLIGGLDHHPRHHADHPEDSLFDPL